MTAVIDAPVADLEDVLGTAPPEECAHIVRRSGQLGAGALITAAAEAGMEVEALCGYRWVPRYGHAPEHLPACVPCVEVWQVMAAP